jgi:ABC-type transport system involved in cytochrome c biogenesis permease subunit
LLYIHPPIAIASYAFIFILTALIFKRGTIPNKHIRILALTTWFLTAAGLFTGMLWAQIAWGSYWSWDAKETLTLALFVMLSAALVAYFEKKTKTAKYLLAASCVLAVLTALTSFAIIGLHSFL